MDLKLTALPEPLTICRLAPDADIPRWAISGSFFSITRQQDELSIVCAAETVPPDVRQEGPWRALKVLGQLDFSLTGILASLATPLAQAQLSIFAISTFDTDFILVRSTDYERTVGVLGRAGFSVLDRQVADTSETRSLLECRPA